MPERYYVSAARTGYKGFVILSLKKCKYKKGKGYAHKYYTIYLNNI